MNYTNFFSSKEIPWNQFYPFFLKALHQQRSLSSGDILIPEFKNIELDLAGVLLSEYKQGNYRPCVDWWTGENASANETYLRECHSLYSKNGILIDPDEFCYRRLSRRGYMDSAKAFDNVKGDKEDVALLWTLLFLHETLADFPFEWIGPFRDVLAHFNKSLIALFREKGYEYPWGHLSKCFVPTTTRRFDFRPIADLQDLAKFVAFRCEKDCVQNQLVKISFTLNGKSFDGISQ